MDSNVSYLWDRKIEQTLFDACFAMARHIRPRRRKLELSGNSIIHLQRDQAALAIAIKRQKIGLGSIEWHQPLFIPFNNTTQVLLKLCCHLKHIKEVECLYAGMYSSIICINSNSWKDIIRQVIDVLQKQGGSQNRSLRYTCIDIIWCRRRTIKNNLTP